MAKNLEKYDKLVIVIVIIALLMLGIGYWFAQEKSEPVYRSKIDRLMFDKNNKSPAFLITLPDDLKAIAKASVDSNMDFEQPQNSNKSEPVEVKEFSLEKLINDIPSLSKLPSKNYPVTLKNIETQPELSETDEKGNILPKIDDKGHRPWIEYGQTIQTQPNFKNFNKYYALTGKCENKDYLLLLDKLGNIVFEDCADLIELNKNNISTLNKIQDIAKHGFVSIYKVEENNITLTEQYTVFLNQTPTYTKNKYCISTAFLEALNLNNLKLARYYLSDELNATLNDQQLTSFFGDYTEFEPNFLLDANNSVFFVYNSNIVKTYNFEIKENKIVDITTD